MSASNRVPNIKEILKAGQRWHRTGKVLGFEDELVDLSQMEAKMEFRSQKSGELLANLDHVSGIKLFDDTQENNYELDLSSTQSMNFNGHDVVLADLLIIDGDLVYPIFNLQLRIERTQTQWHQK